MVHYGYLNSEFVGSWIRTCSYCGFPSTILVSVHVRKFSSLKQPALLEFRVHKISMGPILGVTIHMRNHINL